MIIFSVTLKGHYSLCFFLFRYMIMFVSIYLRLYACFQILIKTKTTV